MRVYCSYEIRGQDTQQAEENTPNAMYNLSIYFLLTCCLCALNYGSSYDQNTKNHSGLLQLKICDIAHSLL